MPDRATATRTPARTPAGLGPGALTDAELLAVLLRNGVAGTPVLDLARDVLTRFGGCAGVLGAGDRRHPRRARTRAGQGGGTEGHGRA